LDSLGDGVLVVEWPERAGPGAWPEALRLSLEILDPRRRRLTAEVPAAWEGRWPPR
jgi:tRNA threonylcarbamoyladenosine biosynthesis protein TsaE